MTRGWPETGFLRKLLVIAQKLKKTRFLRLRAGKIGHGNDIWFQRLGTTNSPVVRQGLKPPPQSESRLKTTEELMSRLQTTFAMRQGINSLADYRVGEKTRWMTA